MRTKTKPTIQTERAVVLRDAAPKASSSIRSNRRDRSRSLLGRLEEHGSGREAPFDAMSQLGHVWTAPWQELSDVSAALVGCGHVSGLT